MATITEICDLVNNGCCSPDNQSFKKYVLQLLCALASASASPSTRFDWEYLCDPVTNTPIAVKYAYLTDGTSLPITAFNADGTPYLGVISDLVACPNSDFEYIEEPICDNGITKYRVVPFLNAVAGIPFFLNALGAPVAAPADPNLVTAGVCPLSKPTIVNERGCLNRAGVYTPIQIIKIVDDTGLITAERYYNFGTTTEVFLIAGDVVSPECPKRDVIGTLSLCAKETLPGAVPTCVETVTEHFFPANASFVDITVISTDGLGNFVVEQEMATPAYGTALFDLLMLMSTDNTRMVENIAAGALILNFWEGNISNVTLLTPTRIRYTFHVQPGVTDTPDALIAPCVDPVADATYQTSAATLFGIFTGYPIGVPQPNGQTNIAFTVTSYSQVLAGGAETFIPLQEIKFLESDGTISVQHFLLGTNAPYVPTVDAVIEYLHDCPTLNVLEEEYAGQTCYDNGTPEEGLAIRILVKTDGIVTSIRYIDSVTGVDVTALITGCATCCDAVPVLTTQLYVLYSRLGDGVTHPDNASYTGVGITDAAAVHPSGADAGQSISGWYVYVVCASTPPVDDSNNHYWIVGSPDDYIGVAPFVRGAADPVCT